MNNILHFPKDNSERSKLFCEIAELDRIHRNLPYDLLEENEIFEQEKLHELKIKRQKENIKNNPILRALDINPEITGLKALEKTLYEYSCYIEKQHLPIIDKYRESLIENNMDNLTHFFLRLYELYIIGNSQKFNTEINIFSDSDINTYEKEVEKVGDFFKALEFDLIPFAEVLLEDIFESEYNKLNFVFLTEAHLAKLFRFCKLQYKAILEETILPLKTPKIDHFLSVLEVHYPLCHNAIIEAIKNNEIIKTNRDTLYFINLTSCSDVGIFLKEGAFNGWREGLDILEYKCNKNSEPKLVDNNYRNATYKSKKIKALISLCYKD